MKRRRHRDTDAWALTSLLRETLAPRRERV